MMTLKVRANEARIACRMMLSAKYEHTHTHTTQTFTHIYVFFYLLQMCVKEKPEPEWKNISGGADESKESTRQSEA